MIETIINRQSTIRDMKKYRQNGAGMTLMEILVVVTIIGIMAGIGIPNFMRAVKNNRVRARTLEFLAAVRKERSRAIALNRRVQMTIDAPDSGDPTYSVQRLAYTLYDPLSADPYHPEILSEEEAEVLLSDVVIDTGHWLADVDPVILNSDTDLTTLDLTFTPSGTAQVAGVVVASIKLQGDRMGYEIKIYKAGQIDLFRF